MENKPRISDAEWQVMKVLWAKSPITANEIVDRLSDATSWKPKTIRTLINRLVTKKAIAFDKQGRQYLYYPLLAETASVRAETQSFISKIRTSTLKPMLAAFLEDEDLSKEEIEELKKILEEKGGK
ncbi:MAG: BlaI/MecI/CopY family transcriptional regulator [Planctomycetes bacterium]|nr:BlaI/MecI/CopY family transcriptional regulator [Planctomycetota bacterium]